MKAQQVLKMLNEGKTEELKTLLSDEIYKSEIQGKDGRNRYSAMKRFFRFADKNGREVFKKPCRNIEYNGNLYNCFMDNYCFVITPESIGVITDYDNSNKDYFNVAKFISFNGDMEKLDLNAVLANAKAKGYKFKKCEIGANALYLFKYKETYYKIGLLDKVFSIINDWEEAEVYYSGKNNVLIIKNSIGIAGICPVKLKNDIDSKIIIIEN